MPSPSEAASEAARALIQSRWDRVTDPAARRQQTEAARKAVIRKGIDRRITELLAVAPSWTEEQRERIATVLKDGHK